MQGYIFYRLNDHKVHTLERLEKEVLDVKEEINAKSEELDIRQRCLQVCVYFYRNLHSTPC